MVQFDEVLDGCVACGSPLHPFATPVNKGMTLTYEGCERCGLVQMNPRPTTAELDRYYATEYRVAQGDEDGNHSSEHQHLRSQNLRDLVGATPKRQLDVGCSMGILLETFGAAEQVGIEPGEQHRTIAASKGLEVHESLEALVASDPEPFDLISISHVLEHVPDPVAFLTTLGTLLTPDGRLCIEVPSLYGSSSYEIVHLLCFTPASLPAVLGIAGFEVETPLLHSIPQGGRGSPKLVAAVVRQTGTPVTPTGSVNLRLMRVHRALGRAPLTVPRWARRQGRRISRRARGLVGR